MGGGAPIRLTRDAANELQPDFSPDGTQIAFRSEREGGGIYVVPALGGEARPVAHHGRDPRFSPDGKQIAYWVPGPISSAASHSIHVVASTGGRPRRLCPDFSWASGPVWAPDGKHLVFVGTREVEGAQDWWVAQLDGGPAIQTGAAEVFSTQRWPVGERKGWGAPTPDAWFHEEIIFSDSPTETSDLWGIPISNRTWRVAGKPRRLTSGTGSNIGARVSVDGQVVFATVTRDVNVWSLPLDANRGKVTGGLERLTQGASAQMEPCLSPDGKTLAFVESGPTKGEIILKDLASGKEGSVFVATRYSGFPEFSRDSRKLAFATGGADEKRSLYVVPVAGGIPEMVCEDCGLGPSYSADGTRILYDWGIPRYVGLLEIATRQTTKILADPQDGILQGRFSPDDRWICFQRAIIATSRNRLMVAPFRGAAEIPESQWIPVTDGTAYDMRPRWSPDGNLIYFNSNRDGFQCLWAQRLDPATKRPVGATFSVFHFHSARRSLASGSAPVGPDRVAMRLDENVGNIWMFKLPEEK